ncbi:glyoxalase [Nibribacter ruber]|uniref:Glyoxalase n=1 Tax=Nibribacter ruber TaxID=2698458 RepID=A0A6P1NU60_9BACT|nr:VOC family protein [Nibribacter ruber]QHL87277.1 glyoxalase [Nibribacter ruber]
MEFTQIKETCLYVQDLKRTTHFYAEVLRLPVIGQLQDCYVFFRVGTSVLLCFDPEKSQNNHGLPPHSGSGHVHLAFECQPEEYEAWKEMLLQANISIEHEELWPQGRKSCYFRDPDHHLLEIIMPGIWGE